MNDGIKTTFEATIKGVERRELNRKSDGKPFTLYEIETHDGTKWSTGKAEDFQMANSNVGGKAQINGTIKQNGSYTNYYLDSLIILEAPVSPVQPSQEPVDFKTFAAHHDATEAKRDVSIHRQVAAKVAAWISEDAVEFWGNVGEIFTYFQTGDVPSAYVPVVAPAVQTVANQSDMSHSFPEDAGHPDDDIPF